MTDGLTDQERAALIHAVRPGALAPGEDADVTLLAGILADPATWAEPRTGLEDAVVHAVLHGDASAIAPVRPLHPTATPRRAGASAPRRRHHQRRVLFSSAAAAIATIAIVTGIRLGGSEATPDFEARLTATALAPGADASADLYHSDAGFRVELAARGLPPLPAREYYQAWLRNADGAVVPIGTFSSSDGRVTLWSGVSPSQFPTLSVTIETARNGHRPPGHRVLVGDVHHR